MYVHDFEQLTFRLSCWPWGGRSYRKFYHNRRNIGLKSLADFLAKELDVNHFRVFRTTFTLVSVYSKFTDRSYGHMTAPHPSVTNGHVTFTFKMRNNYCPYVSNKRAWISKHTCMWGNSGTSDYVTVSIPLNLCMRARLNNTLRLQMEMMYKVLGGITKNVVQNHRSILFNKGKEIIRADLLDALLVRVMQHHPIEDWIYCREFWSMCPDLLTVEKGDARFAEYYLTYLAGTSLRYQPEFKKYLAKRVKSGILALLQHEVTDDSELVAMVRPEIKHATQINVEQTVIEIMEGR